MDDGDGVLDGLLACLLRSQLQTQRSVPRTFGGISENIVRLDQEPVHRRLLSALVVWSSGFAAMRSRVKHFGLADVVKVCKRPFAAVDFHKRIRHGAVGGSGQELVRLQ